MKRFFPTIILTTAIFAPAAEMESLHEQPWVGYWAGYEEKEFDFGVGAKGEGELFLKQKQQGEMERISLFRALKFNYVVQEKSGDKWINRTMEKDGFETAQAATAEPEKVEFDATYKGGAVTKVTHSFDREEVTISIGWVKKPEANEARVGVEVTIPDLYRISGDMDERDIKRKMRGDEIRAVRTDKKKFKYDLDEDVNLGDESELGKGAVEFEISSNQLARKTVSFRNKTEGGGTIVFDQKKSLHGGFTATWYPDPSVKDAALVVEVK